MQRKKLVEPALEALNLAGDVYSGDAEDEKYARDTLLDKHVGLKEDLENRVPNRNVFSAGMAMGR